MTLASLDSKMQALCSLDASSVQPLELFTKAEATVFEGVLLANGWELNPPADAVKLLWDEKQFRSADQGRGPGMEAVLGKKGLERLLLLCQELAIGTKHRIKQAETGEPIEGTEGRGLQQAAADIVSMGVYFHFFSLIGKSAVEARFGVGVDFDFVEQLNKRVLRWWSRKARAGKISEEDWDTVLIKFTAAGVEIPSSKMASVEPDQLWQIWLFLTGRRE